jgi:hypothetical protein
MGPKADRALFTANLRNMPISQKLANIPARKRGKLLSWLLWNKDPFPSRSTVFRIGLYYGIRRCQEDSFSGLSYGK